MTRTFAESAAARDAQWIVLVTIEGSGAADGTLYRYCSDRPAYADASIYRPWLTDWPKISGEQVDPLGGLPTNGELEVSILDYGNALTAEWRVGADPVTYLSAALSSADTTAYLQSAAGLAADGLLFVGNECCTVSATGSGTATIARGALDTDASPHAAGTPVYLYLPYLRSRRVCVYLVNRDAASSAEEQLVGSYGLDYDGLGQQDLGVWVVRGKSALKWFSRLVGRDYPRTATMIAIVGGTTGSTGIVAQPSAYALADDLALGRLNWPGGYAIARVLETRELVAIDTSYPRIVERGLGRTEVQPLPDVCTLAFVYPSENGRQVESTWFRWSASSSSSRSSGWVASAHWVDLLLNLALSSADPNDGLELANRDPAYGAWDCLPPGLGVGVPYREVDLAGALLVKARTPDFVFPALVVGDGPIAFADLIAQHFLRPIGAYFSTAGGKARVILPSLGGAGATTIAIGNADVLGRPVGKNIANDMGAMQDLANLPTTIIYTLADGQKIRVNNQQLVQSAYYGHEERSVDIQAPSAVSAGDDRAHFLLGCGERRILRARRPPWVLSPPVSYERYAAAVGDGVSITHAELPDQSRGVRGWSDVYGEVSKVAMHVDATRGLWFEWEVTSLGPGLRPTKIAPAGRVASVASASGGRVDVTLTTNRYAQADAAGAWNATDAAGFLAGDVVGLYTRAGAEVTATRATVVSVAGDVVRLSSSMGGALTAGTGNAGKILRYAPSADAATAQLDDFAYWADLPDRTIGATTRPPAHYGEP